MTSSFSSAQRPLATPLRDLVQQFLEGDRAAADALASARAIRSSGVEGLLVDTAPRPQPFTSELAAATGFIALPLPASGATGLSRVIGDFVR